MTVRRKKHRSSAAKVVSKKGAAGRSQTGTAGTPKPAVNPIQLRDTVVSDKLIELPSGVRSWLGPFAEFRGCRIVMPRDAEVMITDATLVRCTLVANLRSDPIWNRVFWKDCRFEGVFHKTGLGPYKPGEGDVARCDFRDAKLHWFELRNCAPESSQFAPWPTFVVLYPSKNKEAIRAIKWPGWMTFIMTATASMPESKSAVVFDAELLLKELARNGTKLSLKELHDSLAQLGSGIILDGGPPARGARKAASLN